MTDELNPQTQTPETIETPEILAFDYRYIALLGEGANGKTWKAKNRQTGQLVAIKALKLSQSENFKSFELFKREAEVLASVRIQGVPQFYQSVNTDEAGGECFIVQEYIDAPAIQTYLDKGRIFTESETLKLILHVAEILHALHSVYTPPIIHRDIKPSNILCEMPEGVDIENVRLNPYLIDFGAVANPQNKSGSSTIAGTYGYMAPEQMLGECETQSDFYALGATALHMLTGKPPYELDADVFKLKYEDALNEYAPNTSANMRELLGMMLQPERSKRPANAEDLITKINYVIQGLSPSYKPEEGLPVEEKKTFGQKILAFLSGSSNNYTPNSRWITVPGVVRAYSMHSTKCVEYTFRSKDRFFTKGRLWAGLYPVQNLPSDQQELFQLPIPCQVQYNPDNPRLNVLLSIDISKAKKAIRH
ncbi:MAG: serine/threonine protein kinase [Proteobacteria bacterium]|nr:serine/threonine protein kinase [Pseudomonadota bacterium]